VSYHGCFTLRAHIKAKKSYPTKPVYCAVDAAWEKLTGTKGVWDTPALASAQIQWYWRLLCRCDVVNGDPATPPPVKKRCHKPASTPVVVPAMGGRHRRSCVETPQSNPRPKDNRGGARNTGMRLQKKPRNHADLARRRFKGVLNPLKARDLRAANRRKMIKRDWVNKSRDNSNATRRANAANLRWRAYIQSGDPTWYKEHAELLKQHLRLHSTHELLRCDVKVSYELLQYTSSY